jgi:hypothetical protein
MARDLILMKSVWSSNDILRQATDAKRARLQ